MQLHSLHLEIKLDLFQAQQKMVGIGKFLTSDTLLKSDELIKQEANPFHNTTTSLIYSKPSVTASFTSCF